MSCYTISVLNNVHISEKVVAAAFFGVVLLSFALWKSPLLQSQMTNTTTQEAPSTNPLTSPLYTNDTDKDGIKDWEEKLLGMNPNSKDSDGDGIPDGKEVALARATLQKNILGTTTPETSTDALTADIFGPYIQSKQQGTYNPETFAFVLAKAADTQFNIHATALKTYTTEQLDSIPDSKNAIALYKEKLNTALIPITTIDEYELATFSRAMSEHGDDARTKLKNDARVYTNVIDNLAHIPVPKSALQGHLSLLNAFSTLTHTLDAMASSLHDPVRSLVLTRDFLEDADSIKNAYTQLSIYFTLNTKSL